MFGLFKRSKIYDWEIQLVRNVINALPTDYSSLLHPVNEGLFKGVIVNASDIPGYVAFRCNYDVLNKYHKKNSPAFKLDGIKVYDNKTSAFAPYGIYVSSGVINGYVLNSSVKPDIDVNRFDISEFRKVLTGLNDYNRIANIFTEEEKGFFNPSDVYSVTFSGKEYFHIKDLGDGDFIGIDKNKAVYKITHDPLEAKLLNKNLVEVLI